MMNGEVKTEEDARCIAVDYAARHDASEHKAKEIASSWFKMGDGGERSTETLLSILKRQLGIL